MSQKTDESLVFILGRGFSCFSGCKTMPKVVKRPRARYITMSGTHGRIPLLIYSIAEIAADSALTMSARGRKGNKVGGNIAEY